MNEPTSDRDPFEAVAESFLARYRAGERPSITEYAARHPELAEKIRRLLAGAGEGRAGSLGRSRPGAVGSRQGRGPFEAAGRLPDPSRDRPGRHGGGVRGRAGQPGPPGGAEGPAPPGRAAIARMLERFRREAKAAARLHHTNIVPVFEVGQDGETAYLRHAVHPGPGSRRGHRRAGAGCVDDGRTRAAVSPGLTAVAQADRPRHARDRLCGRVALDRPAGDRRGGLVSAGMRPARL